MGGALVASPWAGVDSITDGHGPVATGRKAIGLDAEIGYALNSYIGIGLGLRYIAIPLDQIDGDLAHRLSAPLLLVGGITFESGNSIEAMFGLGYTTALYPGFDSEGSTSGSMLRASGASGEVLFGYVHALSPKMAVTGHAGVRAAFLEMDNGVSYWENSANFFGELVLRVGLRFR